VAVAVAAAEAGRRQPCGSRSKSHGLGWREQMADPIPLFRTPSTGRRRAGGDGGARRDASETRRRRRAAQHANGPTLLPEHRTYGKNGRFRLDPHLLL
jgi:hypothetical protein